MSSLNIYINEKHKDYLYILAYMYLKNNQMEKAITVYKALWHLFPESESPSFCLSYLHLHTRQFESALFYADTYLAKKNTPLGFLLKSQALFMLGRNFEAKKVITHFLN
jgi:tetratricopeptide (TPR) repeat protein